MHYLSTALKTAPQTLSQAIRQGLAPDGGLFIPEHFPKIQLKEFETITSYPLFTQKLLAPFFAGDPLENELPGFCERAFNFPLPLKKLDQNSFILELFHGPTLSFKDFGARFLAETLSVLSKDRKTTIMVATSGDTGSAVASAFHLKPQLQVIVLYPRGKISTRQEQQITCFGDNVLALAVEGHFDDCQALVKAAFHNREWQQALQLSSANSINIGRLLPQLCYYAYTSLHFFNTYQEAPGFIIPTGNLGNATAAYWAKALGFPIREIVLATNANAVIPDFIQTGQFKPRASISTLANAMDVGNPSNFERLHHLFPDFLSFKANVSAWSVKDAEIQDTIQQMYRDYQTLVCPHTATACFIWKKLQRAPWIIVSTADPCKFDEVLEPLLPVPVPVAPALKMLLEKPTEIIPVEPQLSAIKHLLEKRGLL